MQTISESPFVFRPDITPAQRSLTSSRKNEIRLVPFALVPQVIQGMITQPGSYAFVFDYLINEPEAPPITYSRPVMIHYGKHSGKVLKITIAYGTVEDIFSSLEIARILISERKESATKAVMKHYYALVFRILEMIERDLRADSFSLPLFADQD